MAVKRVSFAKSPVVEVSQIWMRLTSVQPCIYLGDVVVRSLHCCGVSLSQEFTWASNNVLANVNGVLACVACVFSHRGYN